MAHDNPGQTNEQQKQAAADSSEEKSAGAIRQSAVDGAEHMTGGKLEQLDRWCEAHPWHPRVAPWLAYMVLLMLAFTVHEFLPQGYGVAKVIQLCATVWLCWRYRKLVPELNWKFHWLVIPSAILLTLAWVGARQLTEISMGALPGVGDYFKVDPENARKFWFAMAVDPQQSTIGPVVWFGLVTHLLAMTIAVPMIEEVFNRSVLLRSFHRFRQTMVAGFQFLVDMPIIGDWLIHTKWGEKASRRDPILGNEFKRLEVGQLTAFGVIFSSLVFALVHHPADWLGSVICGVVWCLMLAVTRKQGLGPIIWSHALTNLFLWIYVVAYGQWQFV